MQPSTANTQHDRGSAVPAGPARAAGNSSPGPRGGTHPATPPAGTARHRAGPGLPDCSAARGAAGRLPRDGAPPRDRRGAALHRGMPWHPEDDPPVPAAVRRRFRGQRPEYSRSGRLRRPVAGAGDRPRSGDGPPAVVPHPCYASSAAVGQAGVTGLRAAAPTWRCSSPAAASRPSPHGRSARGAQSAQSCLDYAISHGLVHGIWGGMAERDRRALRSRYLGAARRERDAAIAAASDAGYTQAAIGRAFGLTPYFGEPGPSAGRVRRTS